MSKPSWEDAPEWANYLAMDADGEWMWYEEKPHWSINSWHGPGLQISAGYSEAGRDSLDRRP